MSMSQWLVKNTRHRKRPFSFEGFEFQKQIVDDMHQDLACIKCSQIGLSEIQIRKNFAFLKRNNGVSTIFTLPNEKMYKRISSTRAKPIVDGDAVFNMDMGVKPIRSMSLYQIDQSFGYFTGMTEGDATSIAADALWHDEVDLSDQQMMGLFQSRLQASRHRITQGFSTPTFEGFGIDAAYKVSDQHEYMARCPRCRHHNVPTFAPQFLKIPGLPSDLNRLDEIDHEIADRLDFDNAKIICERCGGELPIADPSTREWVPMRPGAKKRGYRVRPFCVGFITIPDIIKQLLKQKDANRLRSWYNTVLGEPFNDSNARLTETDIRAVMTGLNDVEVSSETPVAIGIDVGQTCHVVLVALHAQPVVFKWLQIQADKLPKAVEELRKQYNIVVGGMDRHPYEPTANQIRDESDAVIFPIEYRGSDTIRIVLDEFEQLSHVQANRTKAIDAAVAAIRKSRIQLAGYGHLERLIIEHFMDMIRIEEPGTDSSILDKPNEWNKPAVWNKTTGNDHFMHALVFALAAIKARDVQNYNADEDPRTMFGGLAVTVTTRNDERLGLRRMSPQAISLGTAQG